ncbi:MAG: alpha/beta hydrolase [Candidatus Moranbacteria bacterium]|nr:alpha/beta hydrolase [Candidatus Moranbacteria bacterium]
MQQQIWLIHGGEAFDTYEDYLENLKSTEVTLDFLLSRGWKSTIQSSIGEGYRVIAPRMPSGGNAKYVEWKIWFEKLIPFMTTETVLVGHSLGGIFLAKYLSEEMMPVKVRATFLIAAPFDTEGMEESLGDFSLPEDMSRLPQQGGEVVLYQSKDDPVVPFAQVEKYRAKLPSAKARIFTDKQHFNQETFPELAEDILFLRLSKKQGLF